MNPDRVPVELYFSLLAYRLRMSETDELLRYLKPGRMIIKAIEETINLKNRLDTLAEANLPPSRVHSLLEEYSTTAVMANQIATDSKVIRRRLDLCLEKYRQIKTTLNGDDLCKMGIAPGPHMKSLLRELLNARLDGKVRSKNEEIAMVKVWQEKKAS